MIATSAPATIELSKDELLKHWQGHRRVTRRVIEAFPERDLFTYSVGSMRPAAELAMEMIGMTGAGIRGLATGQWDTTDQIYKRYAKPQTKAELLAQWDEVTADIDRLWAETPASRFSEIDLAFGQWEGRISDILLYWIDNEVHHRGQAYVYLRTLGIEPPAFYDRG